MKLDAKQKVLLPIIIIAFIFIGWQIYDMFGSSNKNKDGKTKSVIAQPKEEVVTPASSPESSSRDTAATTSVTASASADNQLPQTGGSQSQLTKPEQKEVENINENDETQSEIYAFVKETQRLQNQEMLLRQKLAIAETRQKIADLNSKIASLGGSEDLMGTSEQSKDMPPYKLVYIDYQGDKWAATLSDKNGGNLQEVIVGTKLPDGTKVTSINAKGVTVRKEDNTALLTFSGSVPLGVMEAEEDNDVTYEKPVTSKKVVKTKKPTTTTTTTTAASSKKQKKVATSKAEAMTDKQETTQKTTSTTTEVKIMQLTPTQTQTEPMVQQGTVSSSNATTNVSQIKKDNKTSNVAAQTSVTQLSSPSLAGEQYPQLKAEVMQITKQPQEVQSSSTMVKTTSTTTTSKNKSTENGQSPAATTKTTPATTKSIPLEVPSSSATTATVSTNTNSAEVMQITKQSQEIQPTSKTTKTTPAASSSSNKSTTKSGQSVTSTNKTTTTTSQKPKEQSIEQPVAFSPQQSTPVSASGTPITLSPEQYN